MSKFTIILAVVTLCILQLQAKPLGEDLSILEDENQEVHSRVRRFTCDVLSVEAKGVKLNHAACGLHCLFKRRSGGYCNSKRVCICR